MSTSEQQPETTSPPTTINPYTVLSLTPTATADGIKSAYRKLALKHHPDKVPASAKESAHAKFQDLAFAYAILSDPARRRRYDATGNTSESLVGEGEDEEGFDWTAFYRAQFADVVTGEGIAKFAGEYRGGEEEAEAVLVAFVKWEGKMEGVYEEVMLSDAVEDEERFRGVIDRAIEEGRVEGFGRYVNESVKARKARVERARKRKVREAKEAEEAERELQGRKGKSVKKVGGGGMEDLAALIQQRQKGRAEGFFDGLEAKYAGQQPSKGKKGSKRAADDEPSEEAFARNRKLGKEDKDGDVTGGARRSRRSGKA